MRPPPTIGLADLGLLHSALHAFVVALQVVVEAKVSATVTPPSPSALTIKVETLPPLHLHFTCGVTMDEDLPPI